MIKDNIYFQVRISVLKEEKRLLALQLKAKNNKLNMRTIGVGDCRVDDILPGMDSLDSSELHIDHDHEYRTYMEVNLAKTLPPPRPRPPMRSIGEFCWNLLLMFSVMAHIH